jgi:hypothetical protein
MGNSNKLMLNKGILTSGNGNRRVVLDFESCLIYQYQDPANVLAYYASGKGWVIRQRPSYHAGGWGRGGSGDAEGHYQISNAQSLLNAINARSFELNSQAFLTPKEMRELNQAIAKQNALAKLQNALAKRLGQRNVETEQVSKVKRFEYKQLNKGQSTKGMDPIKTAKAYENAVLVFTDRKGSALKIDSYNISKDLVTQDFTQVNWTDSGGRETTTGKRVVAFRDSAGQVFINSEVLELTTFEKNFMGSQSMVQAKIRDIAKFSIPFNVLASANLTLSETKVLEQGPESTHQIRTNQYRSETVERHFTGALLLENAGRKFLMDIDRNEIQHQIFNAFFVEVTKDVTSIAGAYESMKPQSVRDAELAGTTVKRQGEWFFIKTDKTVTVPESRVKRWEPSADELAKNPQYVIQKAVAHGKGRPNNLWMPVGFEGLEGLVCGTVTHQGREHKDLDLGSRKVEGNQNDSMVTYDLWTLVPNTTVGNFTITGDID